MAVKAPRLKEGYYLENFQALISFIESKYGDILKKEEKLFIKNFKGLPQNSQRLFVRLISRTGPNFRLDKLNYPEIKHMKKAIEELCKKGFMYLGEQEVIEKVLLYTKPELVDFMKTIDSNFKGSKYNKAEMLEEVSYHLDEFEAWVSEQTIIMTPLGAEIVDVFRLLFFGNLEQTLSDFILEDIGVLKYEPYRILKKDRFFDSRKVLDETYKLICLQADLYFAREEGDFYEVEDLMKQVLKIKSPNLKRKVERLCRLAGQFYEKEKDFDRALYYYKKSSLPPARERAVRVLEKLDEDKKALNLCKKMEKDPIDDSEREFLKLFPEKLKRKMGKDYRKAVREVFDTDDLKVPRPREERIEPWSLKHLEKQGLKGLSLENYLWNSLFGLIFWDIIFKSKPGVFFNPFQRGPKDLYSPDFYLTRKREIRKRINEIGKPGFKESVLKTYTDKQMTANHLVSWKRLKKGDLKKVLNRVPSEHLKAVMERMAENLRANSSGFPDLFVYDPKKKNYQLLEVKGPGDQLQQSQKRWIRYFNEKGIPCKVLKVSFKK